MTILEAHVRNHLGLTVGRLKMCTNTLPNHTCKQQYLLYPLRIAVFNLFHMSTGRKCCNINASDEGLVPASYHVSEVSTCAKKAH